MHDSRALNDIYRDLAEIDRRREGVRYSGTLEDGTPVVVLVVSDDVARHVTTVEGFIAAFERAAAIHHESLLPAVMWGRTADGTLHCAYARLGATSLEPETVTPDKVAALGAQIARGLGAAHDAGLIHGALSASRIVVVERRGALLADLGLFAALSEGGLGTHRALELLGEQGFASPEVQAGEEPDIRSDVYSLGATLHAVLTGGATPNEAARAVANVLQRAIEHAPEDRWPNAAAFAQALAVAGSARTRAPGATTRRGCLTGAAAILAAVAVLVSTYVVG